MKPEETAAAPRARRKRRSAEAPDGRHQSEMRRISPARARAATDVPDPAPFGAGGHRSRSRQAAAPPVGGGGAGRGRRGGRGNGVDYISAVPDVILGDIISLLPTKDAGRVPTLARRWKHLWRSAPLNLDCRELPGFAAADDDALAADVSRILARHPGPGRRLCITTRLLLHYRRPDAVDAWLRSGALDNLEELWVSTDQMDEGPLLLPLPALPAPIFRFAPSLSVAVLADCSIPGSTTAHFPRLKKLALEHVSISEDSLHSMLSSCCPVLECLLLVHSFGFRRARISSSSLRSIGVSNPGSCGLMTLEEIVIEDAPCLERLLYLDLDIVLRVSVIAAPKLETLGCLNDLNHGTTRFVSSSTVIQGMLVHDSISAVSSVKMLAINMFDLSLDAVIDLMRCFSCLETLYVKPYKSRYHNNLWRRKHRNFIASHDIRLKKLVFLNYRGIKSQLNFATFFILNAKMLKTMRFEGGGPYINDVNFLKRQHRLLQLEKRASIDAHFHFSVSRCASYLAHIEHVHELSITDPFECTC